MFVFGAGFFLLFVEIFFQVIVVFFFFRIFGEDSFVFWVSLNLLVLSAVLPSVALLSVSEVSCAADTVFSSSETG